MTQNDKYNSIEASHNMMDFPSFPISGRCIKDPNRMINHGQREQIK